MRWPSTALSNPHSFITSTPAPHVALESADGARDSVSVAEEEGALAAVDEASDLIWALIISSKPIYVVTCPSACCPQHLQCAIVDVTDWGDTSAVGFGLVMVLGPSDMLA
jgi:hypothetical protein